MSSQGIMSGRKANNNPRLCPVKGQHRWWWLTFRIYPLPPILMMEAGFSSETLTSSYGVWYCRWPQSVTCCHLYHRQNPQESQFKPEWFQSTIQLVMYKFHSWPTVLSLVCRQDWPFCWDYGWRRWPLKKPLTKKYIGMFLQHGYWHVTSAIKHQSSPNVKKKNTVHGMQIV